MIALLFLTGARILAQSTENTGNGALDSDVTILGKDETVIPVPPPRSDRDLVIPEPDMTLPDPLSLPPIPPPPAALSIPWDGLPAVDESGEPLP